MLGSCPQSTMAMVWPVPSPATAPFRKLMLLIPYQLRIEAGVSQEGPGDGCPATVIALVTTTPGPGRDNVSETSKRVRGSSACRSSLSANRVALFLFIGRREEFFWFFLIGV